MQRSVTDTLWILVQLAVLNMFNKYSTNSTVQCEDCLDDVTDTLSDTGAISCTECVAGKWSLTQTVCLSKCSRQCNRYIIGYWCK